MIDADLDRLVHHIQGTCQTVGQAVDELELSPDVDWEDKLLDRNIERCGRCEWWMESCELTYDDRTGVGVCEQCEPDGDA